MIQGRLIRAVSVLIAFYSLSVNAGAAAVNSPSVPGEYIIKLKPDARIGAGLLNVQALATSLGVRLKENVSPANGVILVQRPTIETQKSVLASLAMHPMVEVVEPNFIYRTTGFRSNAGSTSLPNDPELSRLWGMVNSGQQVIGDAGTITGKIGIDIDATKAWQIETGSRDIFIAVIDSGVNYTNPDLAPNMNVNQAELNGLANVDDDNNGCVDDVHGCDFSANDGDPMDVLGHGTHVSGTIGANGNDQSGVVGVAWKTRILPVRFLGDDGSGTLANAIKSIDYATAMRVNIMSNSWGGGGFSQTLMDSIARARDAGILFVAAAGNAGNDNDSDPGYPASYQLDNVISVAAVDPTGAVAEFSNFGKTSVHLAAPGVNIVSHSMSGLQSWSGTSMACPHVTGVAALLWSQDRNQTYNTIKSRLLASARPMASLRGRVSTGMVNAYYALTNTLAPQDPDDPFFWQKDIQSVFSDHPYAMNFTREWTVTVPGARRVSLYFTKFDTEAGYDKVTVKNAAGVVVGTMSGKLGETYSPVVEGDTITLSFTTDDTVNAYGFDMSGVAFQ